MTEGLSLLPSKPKTKQTPVFSFSLSSHLRRAPPTAVAGMNMADVFSLDRLKLKTKNHCSFASCLSRIVLCVTCVTQQTYIKHNEAAFYNHLYNAGGIVGSVSDLKLVPTY